jgi:hypothetical protein
MISMGQLRREVMSSVPGWRRPQALIGLFFASLFFATSVDALLLAYRLRAAELEKPPNAGRPVHVQLAPPAAPPASGPPTCAGSPNLVY